MSCSWIADTPVSGNTKCIPTDLFKVNLCVATSVDTTIMCTASVFFCHAIICSCDRSVLSCPSRFAVASAVATLEKWSVLHGANWKVPSYKTTLILYGADSLRPCVYIETDCEFNYTDTVCVLHRCKSMENDCISQPCPRHPFCRGHYTTRIMLQTVNVARDY